MEECCSSKSEVKTPSRTVSFGEGTSKGKAAGAPSQASLRNSAGVRSLLRTENGPDLSQSQSSGHPLLCWILSKRAPLFPHSRGWIDELAACSIGEEGDAPFPPQGCWGLCLREPSLLDPLGFQGLGEGVVVVVVPVSSCWEGLSRPLSSEKRDTSSNAGHVLLFINPEEGCPCRPSSWLIGFHDNFFKGNFLRSSVVSCPRGPVRFPPSPCKHSHCSVTQSFNHPCQASPSPIGSCGGAHTATDAWGWEMSPFLG